MEKLDKQELYKQMQAVYVEENDLRVGDTVRILRGAADNEMGCDSVRTTAGGTGCKDVKIGTIVKIEAIRGSHVRAGRSNWPFFVLEIVAQPRDPVITCKFFTEDGKEYEMSPDSARNYHKAAAKE